MILPTTEPLLLGILGLLSTIGISIILYHVFSSLTLGLLLLQICTLALHYQVQVPHSLMTSLDNMGLTVG